MKSKRCLYGLTGLLSLLGFIGIFTEARSFLAFFAFAVDFQYFFLKSDEMLEEQLSRSAARAFIGGMVTMGAATLGALFLWRLEPDRAMAAGCIAGWAAAVVIYALSTACFGFREKWGLERD